jgi:hypothetical protein
MAVAQQPDDPAAKPAAKPAPTPAAPGPRKLAPGVMRPVDPQRQLDESFHIHDLVEVLADLEGRLAGADPEISEERILGDYKGVAFRSEVFVLEFRFKPVRLVYIDIPQPNGKMKKMPIWYMVYSVTNPGKVLVPTENPQPTDKLPRVDRPPHFTSGEYKEGELQLPREAFAGTWAVKYVDKPVRFIPEFLLVTEEYDLDSPEPGAAPGGGEGVAGRPKIRPKAYRDRVIPVAIGPIQRREDPSRRFYTPLEMAVEKLQQGPDETEPVWREIAPGQTVWGMVTWEGGTEPHQVDPRIDRFSIYLKGLTNAYKWVDQGYQKGDELLEKRTLFTKTLKLNFWRPGDEFLEHEREFRYGIPELPENYEWVYLPPVVPEWDYR